jgi:ferredoxin--NADP+ reductase
VSNDDSGSPMTAPVLRVAVVGSGPAGAYATGLLLAADGVKVQVDMFDRLATPWGLVRSGVAPDHPKIKSVTRVFEKIAQRPGFRFWGNVDVGTDVVHDELTRCYHAVLYATGASADRRLNIPGEDLAGSHAATDFVGWYNGHPDYADRVFDLATRRAVVIGNGNVALDVARMLALTPAELAGTDTADHALTALATSEIEEVIVLGRRGPAQAAFTNPEVRELINFADAQVIVNPAELALGEHSNGAIDAGGATTAARNLELLRGYAEQPVGAKRRRIVLRFCVSPIEVLGGGRVEGVRVAHNELVASAPGVIRARPTGRTEVVQAGLVLRSIGYRGAAVPGVPFDEDGATIHNRRGRVTDPGTGEPVPGVYTAGWVKRGPSGVIGTNKKCAHETVTVLLEDFAGGRLPEPGAERSELIDALSARAASVVDYEGWRAIDEHERSLGQPQRRPRVKLVRRAELLARAGVSGLRIRAEG